MACLKHTQGQIFPMWCVFLQISPPLRSVILECSLENDLIYHLFPGIGYTSCSWLKLGNREERDLSDQRAQNTGWPQHGREKPTCTGLLTGISGWCSSVSGDPWLTLLSCMYLHFPMLKPTWKWNINSVLNYYDAGHFGISRNWFHLESRNQVDQLISTNSLLWRRETLLRRFWDSPDCEHSVHHGPNKSLTCPSVLANCDRMKLITSRWQASKHPPYLRKKNFTQSW